MLMPGNGMLILSKDVVLACKRDCFGSLQGVLATDTASISPGMGAPSCHTINNTWAMQRDAGPKQWRLVDSLVQSYSRTREPYTGECLCYMKECFLPQGRACLC